MTWISRTPRDVVFARGAIALAPGLVSRYGDRVLVCTDTVLASTEPFHRLVEALRNRCSHVAVFDGVQPELPMACISEAANSGRRHDVDVVVGYGGGSAIDLAKLAAVAVRNPGDIARFYGEQMIDRSVLPVIAIPTTAGTGSEVTAVAVVGDDRRDLKVGVSSDRIIPAAAIVDPVLTVGCPLSVTAHSGADAICHAVEAFTARRADLEPEALGERIFIGKNKQSDALAIRAVSLLTAAIPRVLNTPDDLSARSDMAEGSLLAGMAFGNAGTTAAHALQYPLGALTKTPHGLGVGLLLPYTLASIVDARESELVAVGSAMGVTSSGSTQAAAQATIRALRELMLDAGIPESLASIGVSAADLSGLADQAMQVTRLLSNHATDLDHTQVLRIYEAAYRGGDPLENC